MIAQLSTLVFQQTCNITVDLWDAFLEWSGSHVGSPVSLAQEKWGKSYIAGPLAFPFVILSLFFISV